ncbi:hypothetical protein PARPLA_01592 [Rhodobacteraceae bacterium THAF1]|uniref:DUF1353 domain-containing protein n=1 Tax=Palleronia sp. THAF1 TaxID=2587842 RepID=UPI000F403854|nr:DUF1353 domain-containing protein [Palleronia sp. THAF1]QFU07678.1 hypothetical protein FIU81_03205 [Palleronia sp. THAF1]VDC23129.1 hypothetical protein PARPLA_01592 [Rhodobacteraceae bacterium THAF1]
MPIANPYPDDWRALTDFCYLGPLSLIRPPALLLDRIGEDGDYVVNQDYDVALRIDGDSRVITVPRGLITDLTSVPRPLRWFVGRVGPWLEAAIVHDWLYVAWQVTGRTPTARDRLFADDVMLLAMTSAGIGPIQRRAIHLAVRLFGGRGFFAKNHPIFADLSAAIYDTPIVIPTEPDQRGGTGS